ncbi:uncharacterized protein PV09_09042 [Verruconis gallopava]|uniref:Mannosyltransferase n=1 Tax=Verruconis gallopava TaxID=253628 RepID=A0A0D1ZYV9_9PEZI|nr:uncharacterized protein PV09_09042 [Verruconis gallopava]KIV99274.1 hypothetical protein PV09_09042 [Verruconis gallopava]
MASGSASSSSSRSSPSASGPKRRLGRQAHDQRARRRTSSVSTLHVLLVLLALRVVNALTLRTFFVPDEYYQSLEPAWQLAFGPHSGAWITWEWRHQLRSSLHPVLFAAVYRAAALLSAFLDLTPASEAAVLLVAPRVVQAVSAASLDFFTWRLGRRIFGSTSRAAWTILAVSTLSPWQWFCSTRTLSNSLEASLTAAALYCWPWDWMLPARNDELKSPNPSRTSRPSVASSRVDEDRSRPGLSLLLAAVASILRPTNVLVWIPIALQTLSKVSSRRRYELIVKAVVNGTAVALFSAIADRSFYGFFTFPPLRFLTFNIYQDLAVFYGRHRPDYYLTEGLPLLLMGLIPFVLFGLYRSASITLSNRGSASYSLETIVLPILTWTIFAVVFLMSLIAHKEARFVYPLLPCLHIIGGTSVSTFTRRASIWKGFILGVILSLHFFVIQYVSRTHQRGVIEVMHFLREQHQSRSDNALTTAALLMPCHSTPWRSHLVYRNIDAWALTCEPPVNMPPQERANYTDEADVFYEDVTGWLETNMEDLKQLNNGFSLLEQARKIANHSERTVNGHVTGRNRPWPQFLVFFEQLVPQMHDWLATSPYQECKRFFNTHWHDDWRRQGDVVVYCLAPAGYDAADRFRPVDAT